MARFSGPITLEGVETGDDRTFESGALDFLVPSPLWYCHELVGGHEGQVQVGVFETMERMPNGMIWATGSFMDTEDSRKCQAEMAASEAAGLPYGVSVDLDSVSMELRVRSEILAGMMPMPEDEDSMPEMGQPDENGRVTVAEFNSGDFMTVITKALVRGATLVSMPAFKDAYLKLEAGDTENPKEDQQEPSEEPGELAMSLVASAYPVAPPAEWFENPGFTAETPLTIDENGRIYGHAATWNTFHIGFAGQKIEAPRSMADYAYFRTGQIRTENGTDLPIGTITLGTGHAEGDADRFDAMAHYDNTGTGAADVACGEDDFGIWVAGALRPDMTPERVRELRAAALSGDWREIRGNLELVAILAVNTPGFMVPRMSAMVASGSVRSMVASAAFNINTDPDDTIELTREEKVAIREMVAKRNVERDVEGPGALRAPTPKDVFGAVIQTPASSPEVEEVAQMTVSAESDQDDTEAHKARIERAEKIKRLARAERVKLAVKRKG
jgi:hypothetical protein